MIFEEFRPIPRLRGNHLLSIAQVKPCIIHCFTGKKRRKLFAVQLITRERLV